MANLTNDLYRIATQMGLVAAQALVLPAIVTHCARIAGVTDDTFAGIILSDEAIRDYVKSVVLKVEGIY